MLFRVMRRFVLIRRTNQKSYRWQTNIWM